MSGRHFVPNQREKVEVGVEGGTSPSVGSSGICVTFVRYTAQSQALICNVSSRKGEPGVVGLVCNVMCELIADVTYAM